MGHIDHIIFFSRRQRGSIAGIRQLRSNLGKHLGHGKTILHCLFPVNDHTQFLAALGHTVGYLAGSLYGLHDGSHLFGNLPQRIQFPAPYLYGDTAASHGAHVHAGGVHRNFRPQVRRLLQNIPGYLLIAPGFVLPGHHVDVRTAGTAVAASGEHGQGRSAGHGPHIRDILHLQQPFHHRVREIPGLLQSGAFRQLHAYGHLGGVHIRHESRAIGPGQGEADGQHGQRHHQYQAFTLQGPVQKLHIPTG